MPKSWIAIGHRRPIKFAVKSAYGFATDTSKFLGWSRAKARTGYASSGSLTPGTGPISCPPRASNLCRRQTFKIITRPRQHPPCLFSSWRYPPSPLIPIFLPHISSIVPASLLPTIVSSLHNWNRCSRAISTSVVYLPKEINGDRWSITVAE